MSPSCPPSRPGRRSAAVELVRLVDGDPDLPGAPGPPAHLAELADRLRTAAPQLTPRPEFRAALRRRLLAVPAPTRLRAVAPSGARG